VTKIIGDKRNFLRGKKNVQNFNTAGLKLGRRKYGYEHSVQQLGLSIKLLLTGITQFV
jgi:hypothetical protein